MQQVTLIFTLNKIIQRAGTGIAVLFLFFLADSFIFSHFSDKNILRVLPDSSQPINGELTVSVSGPEALAFISDSDRIAITFLEARGRLWRGTMAVDRAIQPGDYALRVVVTDYRDPEKEKNIRPFRVQVFSDRKQLLAGYPSPTMRFTGVAPLWMALACLPLVVGALAGSYYLSTQQEKRLKTAGIVPIVRMARKKGEWEVFFPLGSRHGVSSSDEFQLLSETFHPMGRIAVQRVEPDESMALVPLTEKISPACWIARISG
jgi:hypothetical protein